jgi:hypothetical protein
LWIGDLQMTKALRGALMVQDVWHTLGMRVTRSKQVDYAGAFVPDDLVLYETADFLDAFMVQEANWAFGGYTACYALGRDMQAIVGGDILMFPVFSNPEIFDHAELAVMVEAF